jgi:hypothetical protein
MSEEAMEISKPTLKGRGWTEIPTETYRRATMKMIDEKFEASKTEVTEQ